MHWMWLIAAYLLGSFFPVSRILGGLKGA